MAMELATKGKERKQMRIQIGATLSLDGALHDVVAVAKQQPQGGTVRHTLLLLRPYDSQPYITTVLKTKDGKITEEGEFLRFWRFERACESFQALAKDETNTTKNEDER